MTIHTFLQELSLWRFRADRAPFSSRFIVSRNPTVLLFAFCEKSLAYLCGL